MKLVEKISSSLYKVLTVVGREIGVENLRNETSWKSSHPFYKELTVVGIRNG